MLFLFFLALVNAEEPLCLWACDVPVCHAVCSPACGTPQCERCVNGTGCQRTDACRVQCPDGPPDTTMCPQCEVQCPNLCAGTPGCEVLCQAVECGWRCVKPTNCRAPRCQLQCERPACELISSASRYTYSLFLPLLLSVSLL
jgi:hypothetical protein